MIGYGYNWDEIVKAAMGKEMEKSVEEGKKMGERLRKEMERNGYSEEKIYGVAFELLGLFGELYGEMLKEFERKYVSQIKEMDKKYDFERGEDLFKALVELGEIIGKAKEELADRYERFGMKVVGVISELIESMGRYSEEKYGAVKAYIGTIGYLKEKLDKEYDYTQKIDRLLRTLEIYGEKVKEIGSTVALLIEKGRGDLVVPYIRKTVEWASEYDAKTFSERIEYIKKNIRKGKIEEIENLLAETTENLDTEEQ